MWWLLSNFENLHQSEGFGTVLLHGDYWKKRRALLRTLKSCGGFGEGIIGGPGVILWNLSQKKCEMKVPSGKKSQNFLGCGFLSNFLHSSIFSARA